MLRNMISYSLAGIRKLKVNTFATHRLNLSYLMLLRMHLP